MWYLDGAEWVERLDDGGQLLGPIRGNLAQQAASPKNKNNHHMKGVSPQRRKRRSNRAQIGRAHV